MVTPPCGCSTCVPVDAGQPDTKVCPPVACPAIKCAYGTVPNADPCGCPSCALPDASTDSASNGCTGLDECACHATSNCTVLSPSCYCPFPQCGSGACVCGGGKFAGCAPANLATCANAKARVASLCPSLSTTALDNLCTQSDTTCATECLNEVSACSDISCSLCTACDCAGDKYMACVSKCKAAIAQ
jgi:hypothetical protein